MGRLTTHVLDTASGKPAADLAIDLYRLEGDARDLLKSVRTNDDGRCDEPLLNGDKVRLVDPQLTSLKPLFVLFIVTSKNASTWRRRRREDGLF